MENYLTRVTAATAVVITCLVARVTASAQRADGTMNLMVPAFLSGSAVAASRPARLIPPALKASLPGYRERSVEHHDPRRGPRAEVAGGVVLMVFSPIVGVATAFAAGPGLFPCGLSLSSDEDPEHAACLANAHRKEVRAMRLAYGLAVPLAAGGLALIIHGSYRLHRLEVARHGALSAVRLAAGFDRRGAELTAHVPF
jgi:hypothetical protein